MHLTILFGVCKIAVIGILGFEPTLPVLVVFPLLKTATDLALHTGKHPEEF
jgi:hypothetical protein